MTYREPPEHVVPANGAGYNPACQSIERMEEQPECLYWHGYAAGCVTGMQVTSALRDSIGVYLDGGPAT